ncbi:RHS repeat-associated core domain-containing protein [Burkholderia pyrrocinia]|uniref:RHS repeat-associated core domain-containing protein n=1 Tax=Burkholderia pyrrocinia TaxID=60550 RepID=UPI001BCDD76F|nr:RHS repeat-associated core domain-containing protein [Burkholderia pyrrocinia]QVN23351.1 RHS domain-containing protein [Burkholderia pyrrocinia]
MYSGGASSLGVETFAFDPAGNVLKTTERDDHGLDAGNRQPALLDNLLKDYAGTHYAYDEQGNLRERTTHGTKTVFGWDSFNRMVSARTQEMDARYVYDALGRRIAKVTEPQLHAHPMAGSSYAQMERQRLKQAHGYGLTLYGWDGDTLAYETAWEQRTTTHYVYEPGSFTPLLQASGPMAGGDNVPPRLTSVAYYHCDQIGTPQELSDGAGTLAWSAHYRAWGEAKEAISEAARKAGIRNPIRFAGQYFDAETGLHYNRHRYYDPATGRFISRDPIGLRGGFNVYQYGPNPIGWIDPLGLTPCPGRRGAFRQAKRDLGIPLNQQPDKVLNQKAGQMGQYNQVMMTGSDGSPALDKNNQPIWTREYQFTRPDGSVVLIQDHAAGHYFGEAGVGDQGPHFNARPCENPRTGKVPGTQAHYPFGE